MDHEALEKRKKTIYSLLCDDFYVPMKAKEMAMLLQIPKSQRAELQEVLDALVADGKADVSKKGKYSKAKHHFVTGVFESHPKGFGFLRMEEGEDIYIPESEVHGAMHLDTVQVKIMPSTGGKRKEGSIVKILEHGVTKVVGYYEQSKNFGFVVPDNQKIANDIFIPIERSKGAVSGHKVVCEITDYGRDGRKPEGKIVEILGHVNDPGVDILSIVKAYDLPIEFSEKILNQAERVAKEVSEADMAGRMDIRDWQTVTIDGEDAKDLDDAITLTEEDGIYTLGVHIADVTNYVQEHSALDVEAEKRGTSVYLVDRVIPMLPHTLSNGICSLNQGENRLALSCIMKFDDKGKLLDHVIAETVVRVDRRMSYTSVKKILQEQDEKERAEYEELIPMFERMEKLAAILRKKRMKRGSIDFDFPETKIILDKKGNPVDIRPYERNVATKIIEDFMLAANETVAEDYFWQELPFVYRVHEEPNAEKLERLHALLQACGINDHFAKDVPTPKELSAILEGVRGTPYEQIINTGMLRCMSKALYEEKPKGHYGLVLKDYAHFTSPIRRYPDLAIHRIMTDMLKGTEKETMILRYTDFAERASKQSSEREVIAMQIERKAEDCYKAEYARRHLGECYEGTISGVTQRGLFIELDNGVEGFVPASSLTPSGTSLTEGVRLTDPASGKTWSLGDKMMITIVRADVNLGKIDFEVAPAAKA